MHILTLTRTHLPTPIIIAIQTRQKANIDRREKANSGMCEELITYMSTRENILNKVRGLAFCISSTMWLYRKK